MAQFQSSNTASNLRYSTEAHTSTICSRYVTFLSPDAWNKDQIPIAH